MFLRRGYASAPQQVFRHGLNAHRFWPVRQAHSESDSDPKVRRSVPAYVGRSSGPPRSIPVAKRGRKKTSKGEEQSEPNTSTSEASEPSLLSAQNASTNSSSTTEPLFPEHSNEHQPPQSEPSDSKSAPLDSLASLPRAEKYRAYRSIVTESILLATGLCLMGHVVITYFYSVNATWGISMSPSMAADGEPVLISRYYRRGRGIQVGDLVSFKHPVNEDVRAIKRVLAMPGDFVLRDTPGKGRDLMIQVPTGHCYVEGDNVLHSRDSRMFGPLPLALIRGKVVCRFVGGWLGWLTPWPELVPGDLQDTSDFEET